MPVELPAHSRTTGVPTQLSNLSSKFAAVGVSDERRQQPLVFGDFTGIQMEQPPPTDIPFMFAVVEANRKESEEVYSKVSVDIGNFRQDAAETFQQVKDLSDTVKDLSEPVADIRKAVTAGNPVQPPTDPEAVKHALRDPAARMESARAFGFSWLTETKDNKLWPSSALEDEPFMLYYLKQKEHGCNIESPSASGNIA